MSIHRICPSISMPSQSLSSVSALSGSSSTDFFLASRFSFLSLTPAMAKKETSTIRMGGGPRTYPGGVSKWQWKRMQAKKAKQLLRARLARERQIYEMRKRAELKAAVSELERPWEVVEKAPTLFSVSADEQLKVLADRFQKPGGFDMWSENDGPQLFQTVDGFPSARFFPKGVVHSIKPYAQFDTEAECDGGLLSTNSNPESDCGSKWEDQGFGSNKISRNSTIESTAEREDGNKGSGKNVEVQRFRNNRNLRKSKMGSNAGGDSIFKSSKKVFKDGGNVKGSRGKYNKNVRSYGMMDKSKQVGYYQRARQRASLDAAYASDGESIAAPNSKGYKHFNYKAHDMSLQQDGSYGLGAGNDQLPCQNDNQEMRH